MSLVVALEWLALVKHVLSIGIGVLWSQEELNCHIDDCQPAWQWDCDLVGRI